MELKEENQRRKAAHKPLVPLRKPLVSEHFYHDIFVTEFNIHFGYPRTDSCAKCDSLSLAISVCASNEEKEKLEAELKDYQDFAKAGYNTLRFDQELSRKSWEFVQGQQ